MCDEDTSLNDSDIEKIFVFSQQNSLLYDSLNVNTASLSEESIQLVSQLTRQNDTATSNHWIMMIIVDNAIERCHFCAVY